MRPQSAPPVSISEPPLRSRPFRAADVDGSYTFSRRQSSSSVPVCRSCGTCCRGAILRLSLTADIVHSTYSGHIPALMDCTAPCIHLSYRWKLPRSLVGVWRLGSSYRVVVGWNPEFDEATVKAAYFERVLESFLQNFLGKASRHHNSRPLIVRKSRLQTFEAQIPGAVNAVNLP